MIVYAATKNAGKLRELEAIFAPAGWQIVAYRAYADVEEGDASYADNAALKARALREQLATVGDVTPVLGDDSGLEIAALDGRPGIHSARYRGADASWASRRAALLGELAATGGLDRRARFVCALHYIGSDGREVAVLDRYAGTIANVDRGDGGFSYDAIFVASDGRTFAELAESEKNAISHRARAAARLLAALAIPEPDLETQ